MPPSSSDSRQRKPIRLVREPLGFQASAEHNELVSVIAAGIRKPQLIELRATLILAVTVYLLALGGSVLLGIKTPVLDGVPLCLGPGAFLCLYCRLAFPSATRTAQTIEAAFMIVILGLGLACLSYIAAMMDLPLRDQEISFIDRGLGFDWLRIMTGLDNWPAALKLLDAAYATFTLQLIGTVLVLVIAKRTRELDRFFVTFVCASILAEIASIVVPTLGPMAALAGNHPFVNLPTVGRSTGEIVLALRQGTLKSIDLAAIDGIISFPSLHAAVAVIVPFSLRWLKPLFWPMAVFDALMLVSAVPSGNHYLADIFGGLAVGVLAIVCSPLVQGSLERLSGSPYRRNDVLWAHPKRE
jgi:membrane-associated phospholipid phosphatase